jgi:alpha-N-arabinofuranosidase
MFVNVSELTGPDHSMQWKSDLIGYDALTSYGSPSYYAQQMFSTHHGDTILRTEDAHIPTYTWQPPAKKDKKDKSDKPAKLPPKQQVPSIFYDATRDSVTGTIFLKLVNSQVVTQTVNITLTGVARVSPWGHLTVLRAASKDYTNSLDNPKHIVPESRILHDLGPELWLELPPLSISIYEINAK